MSTAPYTFLVSDKIAIGGLLAYGEPLEYFSFVMNVAVEVAPSPGVRGAPTGIDKRVIHARINDVEDVQSQVPEILRAAAMARLAHDAGKRILVTCAQGRNRSGVVLAEFLIGLGHDPKTVIALIQKKRTAALTNRAFVSWLLRPRAELRGLRTIIAGNRNFFDVGVVRQAVNECPWYISEFVSGGAPGVDAVGELIALERGERAKMFPAKWEMHGNAAGPKRNRAMATYAQGLVLVHDGRGPGSRNMLEEAKRAGLQIHEHARDSRVSSGRTSHAPSTPRG